MSQIYSLCRVTIIFYKILKNKIKFQSLQSGNLRKFFRIISDDEYIRYFSIPLDTLSLLYYYIIINHARVWKSHEKEDTETYKEF